jgi:hypothetical protein
MSKGTNPAQSQTPLRESGGESFTGHLTKSGCGPRSHNLCDEALIGQVGCGPSICRGDLLKAHPLKAHAKTARHNERYAVGAHVDNIILDGDPDIGIETLPQPHRNAVHRYNLPCRPHGSFTELSILEGHYLGVRSRGTAMEPLQYQFDLRFAEPAPVLVRRYSWPWLLVATGLGAFGYGALAASWSARNSLLDAGMIGGVVVMAISIAAVYVALRRTTESLQFRSVHGHAALLSVTGDFRSARRHKNVFAVLSRNVLAAKHARPQEQPQFLRDEMREHHRLCQMGVLSVKEYEASKTRILAAHRPAK